MSETNDYIVRVKISNHPYFPSIERFVVVEGLSVNKKRKIIEFDYRVEYFNENGVNVTELMKGPIRPWTVDNDRKVFIRDENFNKIINPDYAPNYPLIDGLNEIYAEEPDNLDDQWMRAPAFDYFWALATSEGMNWVELLTIYTPLDDSEHKRYDV